MRDILSLEEFAIKRGVSIHTVRGWIKSGKIKAHLIAARWFVPTSELTKEVIDGRSTSPYNKIKSEKMQSMYWPSGNKKSSAVLNLEAALEAHAEKK